MAHNSKVNLVRVKVKLKLPFFDLEGDWEADDTEKKAAWELYVELVTRISVEMIKYDQGLLREALNSLYVLFQETRKILKSYGSDLAKPKGKGKYSFSYIAVIILNQVLRPFLSYWHPELKAYEDRKQKNISVVKYERKWKENKKMRSELNEVIGVLSDYADLLAGVAGIEPIKMDGKRRGL